MLPKRPNYREYEKEIYRFWESEGLFQPEVNPDGSPYCILLPPPNANADLHVGHAMFVIEDLLVRWHRMLGDKTLWLPGTDHAGFETQYVYEKRLSEEGQSRFDFDRETLYQDIYDFVQENSGAIQGQLKKLGFSLDWSREAFTLDSQVVDQVYETFKKMHGDGLVYRDDYLVNYCPHFGTTFADLEVKYVEKTGKLWHIKYPLKNSNLEIKSSKQILDSKSQIPSIRFVTVATTRPETMLGDTAVAVHPDDERYKDLVGQKAILPLMGRDIPIIADEEVDPEFGTGAVKVTPAHDAVDFEIGKRHDLDIIQVIDFSGRLNEKAGVFEGLSVEEGRKKVLEALEAEGLIDKVDQNYTHRVMVSYKGDYPIEPMVMPNWFVSTNTSLETENIKLKDTLGADEMSLGEMGLLAVKKGLIKIIPERFKKQYYQWMENIRAWPISRQIVWGIRIPAWYNVDENPKLQVTFLNKEDEVVSGEIGDLLSEYSLEEIGSGLQSLIAPIEADYIIGAEKPGERYLQETDVFDTWFSSGQWPEVTLGYPEGEDFETFYPTDVLDTMWDILFFWVARMIMFGLYLTGEVPFKHVYLHSMITDEKGAKMSKSKGNVINPLDVVEEFGADPLRMSLLVGSAPGNPVALSLDKVKGFRNFVTKIWNASRFVLSRAEDLGIQDMDLQSQIRELELQEEDEEILSRLDQLISEVNEHLVNFRFSLAGEEIYDFFWHQFCDLYIEQTKERLYGDQSRAAQTALAVLIEVLINSLKLIHPYMPFVTEEIYQKFRERGLTGEGNKKALMISPWPKSKTGV